LSKLNLDLEKDLRGKNVIVTGASRGLGAKTCELLALKGANIAMLARSLKDMRKLKNKIKNSKKHICIKVDFEQNDQIETAIKEAQKFLKKIDIVLHIAGGGYGLSDPLINNNDINKLLQINLLAAMEINRIVVSTKKKNKTLKLIHVGSISSYEATGSVGYNLSKSALATYVRSLGRELYKLNIIVTGIMPGGFIAPNNAMQRLKDKNLRAYNKFIKNRLPRKRMGTTDEILPMLFFLCSKYSSMMGGCMVPIDAGEGKTYLV